MSTSQGMPRTAVAAESQEREHGMCSLSRPQEEPALLTPRSQTFSLQDWERICFCVSITHFEVFCYSSPRKLVHEFKSITYIKVHPVLYVLWVLMRSTRQPPFRRHTEDCHCPKHPCARPVRPSFPCPQHP